MDKGKIKKFKNLTAVSIILIIVLAFTGFAFAANSNTSMKNSSKAKATAIKKDLSDADIILSKYQVFATGKDVSPKVKKITVKNGKKVVPKDEYTVKYYDSNDRKVKTIDKIGDYKVVVEAKKAGHYEGSSRITFTVLGKPQNLTIESTRVKLKAPGLKKYNEEKYENDLTLLKEQIQNNLIGQIEKQIKEQLKEQLKESGIELSDIGENLLANDAHYELGIKSELKLDKEVYRIPDFTLMPETDGDGIGFSYSSSDEKVVAVDEEGNLYPNAIGKAQITISTKGNKLYQPAKIKVYVTVE